MQHDVYSLGVLLLELSVSTSFLQWPNGPCKKPKPNPKLDLSNLGPQKKTQYGKENAIKEKLIILAATKLPNTFGRKYTDVVLSCLTCLEKCDDSFGDSKEFEDDDGILDILGHIAFYTAATDNLHTLKTILQSPDIPKVIFDV